MTMADTGKKLYFECYSGVSGDMTVAALLDLGADEKVLREAVSSLPLEGFAIKITRVKKSGLDACDFDVVLDAEHENHDHDMEYLYGHEHEEHEDEGGSCSHGEHHHHDHDHHAHDHGHTHHHGSDHDHGHTHHHEHGEHEHHHRGPAEIYALIDASSMSEGAKAIAKKTFEILAQAEAKAHGVDISEVHFHEVGAVDSIVDICAAAVCLDDLGIRDVIVSPLAEGYGTVRCQHGIIPVPVPAVVNTAAASGLKIRPVNIKGELITPTGAALMAAIRTESALPEEYSILAVGLGAGKRDYGTAGVVRAMIIE